MRNLKLSLIVILIAALVLTACQTTSSSETTAVAVPPAGIIAQGLVAQGHIEPAVYVDVAFTIPGQLAEILVAEGGQVTRGQVLARLAGGEARLADLARAQQEQLAAQQALDGLQSNPGLVRSQAEAAVADSEKALADARDRLDALQNPDPAVVAQLEAHVLLLEQELADAQDALQTLEDQTSPDALALAQARAAVADQQKALADTREALDSLKNPDLVLINQLEAHMMLFEQQLIDAKADAETLQDGVDPDTLASAQARLAAAQAAVASAEAAAAALELRAPMAGVVVGMTLKAGQFIPAGTPALTIADFSRWVVETDDLTELEVVDVQLDQNVRISLDALPDSPLSGRVIAISQRFEERRGDVTFTVTISVDDPVETQRWGMTGQVLFLRDE